MEAIALFGATGRTGRRLLDRAPRADARLSLVGHVMAWPVLADAEGHLAVLGASDLGWVRTTGRIAVSRDDVADVLLAQLYDDAFIRRMPFVT